RPGAASPAGRARTSLTSSLDEADTQDLVLANAPRGLDLGLVVDVLADQGPCDGAGHRDLPGLDVGLVVPDDLVDGDLAALDVLDLDGGPENDAPVGIELGRVDDLRVRQLRFELRDAALDEALALPRCFVFGILGEVTLGARLGDRLDHGRTLDRLQSLQLFLEQTGASHRQRYGGHALPPCQKREPRIDCANPGLVDSAMHRPHGRCRWSAHSSTGAVPSGGTPRFRSGSAGPRPRPGRGRWWCRTRRAGPARWSGWSANRRSRRADPRRCCPRARCPR